MSREQPVLVYSYWLDRAIQFGDVRKRGEVSSVGKVKAFLGFATEKIDRCVGLLSQPAPSSRNGAI